MRTPNSAILSASSVTLRPYSGQSPAPSFGRCEIGGRLELAHDRYDRRDRSQRRGHLGRGHLGRGHLSRGFLRLRLGEWLLTVGNSRKDEGDLLRGVDGDRRGEYDADRERQREYGLVAGIVHLDAHLAYGLETDLVPGVEALALGDDVPGLGVDCPQAAAEPPAKAA